MKRRFKTDFGTFDLDENNCVECSLCTEMTNSNKMVKHSPYWCPPLGKYILESATNQDEPKQMKFEGLFANE